MKKMWYYTLILLALCFTACQDTDKLEADINSLTDRVAALENKVEMLNGNIEALNLLCQDGMVISNVEHDAEKGIYTLSLSDGTTLKLAERIDGFASVPLITINDAGNWAVSYDNGASFAEIMKEGAPVGAVGKDGITPNFRVGAGDYWEISLDGGNSYAQVLDENGQPVKAVYDPTDNPNQQFTGVVEKDGYLEITLSGGSTVKVPIVPDFFCYFDAAITGEQKIKPGETKTFDVHINGAENTVVTAPMGWTATLAEADASTHVAVLTVVAPQGKVSTRAVADNTRDISILAFKGGFATLTKIRVNPIEIEIGGGDEPEPWDGGLLTVAFPADDSELQVIYPASGNPNPFDATVEGDYWYKACNKVGNSAGEISIIDDGGDKCLKFVFTPTDASGNSYYISAAGYILKTSLDITKKYKLTFQSKADMGTDGNYAALAVTMRTSDNEYSFICNEQGTSTMASITGTDTWKEQSVTFDLSGKSKSVGKVTTERPKVSTTAEDASKVDVRIYVKAAQGGISQTGYIKNLKLEELQ